MEVQAKVTDIGKPERWLAMKYQDEQVEVETIKYLSQDLNSS